jgi:hypothetical protein
MFLVKKGDVGPRVIMVQGILRKLGSGLTIDGDFGEATEAAAKEFQGRSDVRLTPDGQVGISTWQAIERLTGLRVFNIVDAEDPAQRTRVMGGLRRAGARDVIVMYGQSNALASAISQVVASAAASGVAAMVRFYSHGGPGAQNVAGGHDGAVLEPHRAGFSAALMPEMRPHFARLADILAPFGCVDLMGCSVGNGAPGQTLLGGIADAAQRPTEAGVNTQYSDDVGYQPHNFEGPVRQVYPGGATRHAWGTRVQGQVRQGTPPPAAAHP